MGMWKKELTFWTGLNKYHKYYLLDIFHFYLFLSRFSGDVDRFTLFVFSIFVILNIWNFQLVGPFFIKQYTSRKLLISVQLSDSCKSGSATKPFHLQKLVYANNSQKSLSRCLK